MGRYLIYSVYEKAETSISENRRRKGAREVDREEGGEVSIFTGVTKVIINCVLYNKHVGLNNTSQMVVTLQYIIITVRYMHDKKFKSFCQHILWAKSMQMGKIKSSYRL